MMREEPTCEALPTTSADILAMIVLHTLSGRAQTCETGFGFGEDNNLCHDAGLPCKAARRGRYIHSLA